MGEVCRKYIYSHIDYPSETIYAWIPDGYNYIDSFKFGKFFRLFFFQNGLAFKKELLYDGTTRTWTLINIKLNKNVNQER